MKECKTCNEFECGGQGSDSISTVCGNGFTQFETGAVRDTGGKGRMDLLPWCAIMRVSKHMEDALTHYPERNWEIGLPIHTMIDSAFRHLAKYVDGWNDEDHLCAAATNLLMALWTEEKLPEMQDIPARIPRGSGDASPYARRAASFALDGGGATSVPPERQVQQKAAEKPEERCKYWHPELKSYTGLPQCWGTKEAEGCTCGGSIHACTHYPGAWVITHD